MEGKMIEKTRHNGELGGLDPQVLEISDLRNGCSDLWFFFWMGGAEDKSSKSSIPPSDRWDIPPTRAIGRARGRAYARRPLGYPTPPKPKKKRGPRPKRQVMLRLLDADIARVYARAKCESLSLQQWMERALLAALDASPQVPAPIPTAASSASDAEQRTVPERVAAAMGDSAWDVHALEHALRSVGDPVTRSNNARSYITSTLDTATQRVQGTDGRDLLDAQGKPIKVRVFRPAGRGKYRAATRTEIEHEAHEAASTAARISGVRPRS
jgi:hypothetical protein